MSNFDTLSLLLKGLPEVYNKTLGTTTTNADGLTYRKDASNNVNIMDAASFGTDGTFQAISDGQQQSLLGIVPVEVSNISEIAEYIDEIALPGYVFNINSSIDINGVSLGYPRNRSKAFYITLNNKSTSAVSLPLTLTYGNFDDYQEGYDAGIKGTDVSSDGKYFYFST
jgi:hypothetical protein